MRKVPATASILPSASVLQHVTPGHAQRVSVVQPPLTRNIVSLKTGSLYNERNILETDNKCNIFPAELKEENTSPALGQQPNMKPHWLSNHFPLPWLNSGWKSDPGSRIVTPSDLTNTRSEPPQDTVLLYKSDQRRSSSGVLPYICDASNPSLYRIKEDPESKERLDYSIHSPGLFGSNVFLSKSFKQEREQRDGTPGPPEQVTFSHGHDENKDLSSPMFSMAHDLKGQRPDHKAAESVYNQERDPRIVLSRGFTGTVRNNQEVHADGSQMYSGPRRDSVLLHTEIAKDMRRGLKRRNVDDGWRDNSHMLRAEQYSRVPYDDADAWKEVAISREGNKQHLESVGQSCPNAGVQLSNFHKGICSLESRGVLKRDVHSSRALDLDSTETARYREFPCPEQQYYSTPPGDSTRTISGYNDHGKKTLLGLCELQATRPEQLPLASNVSWQSQLPFPYPDQIFRTDDTRRLGDQHYAEIMRKYRNFHQIIGEDDKNVKSTNKSDVHLKKSYHDEKALQASNFLVSSTSGIKNTSPQFSQMVPNIPSPPVSKIETKQHDDCNKTSAEQNNTRLNMFEEARCQLLEEREFDVANIINYLHYNHKKFRMMSPLESHLGSSITASHKRSRENSVIMVSTKMRGQPRRMMNKEASDSGNEEEDIFNSWKEDERGRRKKGHIHVGYQEELEDVNVEELQCLLQVWNVNYYCMADLKVREVIFCMYSNTLCV